jgi:tetratricopeptide (TPR) repeat protein
VRDPASGKDVIALDPTRLALLVGLLYIVAFGALSFLRREGLSLQFAIEGVVVSAVLVGGSYLIGHPISPFLFLILLYLITMRSRLLVDLANMLARRDKMDTALTIYRLALAVWPDASSRLTVLANLGAAELHNRELDLAVETLEEVLDDRNLPRLGLRYESIARYNLGLAYQLKGEDARAVDQLNKAIDVMPGSPAAQAARAALKRRKEPAPPEPPA